MLQVIKCIGNNVGVIDTDDGAIEWVSKEEARTYVNQGIPIEGVGSDGVKASRVSLPYTKCNWIKGFNLFNSMKSYSFNKKRGIFIIRGTNGKEYKGKYSLGGDGSVKLEFNFGVVTSVSESFFQDENL